MRVGDIEAVHFRSVVLHSVFRDGVYDLPSVPIFRQVRKAPFPVILLRDGRRLHLGTVRFQTDRDALRTYAVLVVVVLPGLASFHRSHLRRMDIRDRKALLRASFHCAGIGARTVRAGHDRGRILLHGIDDLFATLHFIQVCKGSGPVIAFVQDQHPGRLYTV